MSNNQNLPQQREVVYKAIQSASEKFTDSQLNFSKEQVFAVEQLMKNSYSMKVAQNNPQSVKLAMYNVAMVGLSLNPQLGQAYLIPRRTRSNEDPKIVLDISYRGLLDIATASNSILCAKSELVYSTDHFEYKGTMERPVHQFDPFLPKAERGELKGAYCAAKLPSGDYLIETMSVEDMHEVRNKSEAYKHKVGPWVDWAEQMYLKCPVKRGFKWWPNQNNQRMASALKLLNEENGEGIVTESNSDSNIVSLPVPPSLDQVSPDVQQKVSILIHRAANANAWSACQELMVQRIKNRNDLAFALHQLNLAKSASNKNLEQPNALNG
jgi:recombination protein RecT